MRRYRSQTPFWAKKLTHRSKEEPPSRRHDRHRTRSRSRSPIRDPKPSIRPRSPPRGPSAKQPPTGPSKTSQPPSSSKAPPAGPRLASPPPKANGLPPAESKSSKSVSKDNPNGDKMEVDKKEDSDPEIAMMRQMMGFVNFKSTKNTKVPGNNVSGVRKEKKTEYRQYMNRVGGFNRPLSPSR